MATVTTKKNFILPITLLIGGIFAFLPFGSAAEFSFRSFSESGKMQHSFASYRWILDQQEFGSHLFLSLKLALIAVLITLFLMVPTVAWLHLKAQSWRPLLEVLTILPLVIPVVALSIGAQAAFPDWLQSSEYELPLMYVILSMPFSFRILDTGMQAIALKTITEAARGLGANWLKTIVFVIAPVIRGSVMGAFFLTFALSLGEFTLTSLLHWDTFPTWVTSVSQQNIIGAIALSIFSLTAAFALLLIISLFTSRARKLTKEAE